MIGYLFTAQRQAERTLNGGRNSSKPEAVVLGHIAATEPGNPGLERNVDDR